MPVVDTFDGENRRIVLDASVADGGFDPIDIYREHREWRTDPANRRWFPLVQMVGGAPEGAGTFEARTLVLLTDDRPLTTKIVAPDIGAPYTVNLEGRARTDVADTDPEIFDLELFPAANVVVRFQPPSTQIVEVEVGGTAPVVTGDVVATVDAAEIASAVWNADTATHKALGTFGALLQTFDKLVATVRKAGNMKRNRPFVIRPTEQPLEWVEGDRPKIPLTVCDPRDGEPRDLTGFETFAATIRKKHGIEAGVDFDVDASEKATGVLYITPPAEYADGYSGFWDLKGRDAAGAVETFMRGTVKIHRSVTNIEEA